VRRLDQRYWPAPRFRAGDVGGQARPLAGQRGQASGQPSVVLAGGAEQVVAVTQEDSGVPRAVHARRTTVGPRCVCLGSTRTGRGTVGATRQHVKPHGRVGDPGPQRLQPKQTHRVRLNGVTRVQTSAFYRGSVVDMRTCARPGPLPLTAPQPPVDNRDAVQVTVRRRLHAADHFL